MQYFLGEFDGHTFRETLPAPQPRFVDSGYDDYAAVTFFGCEKRLLMGWAEAITYAADGPTGEFCGLMTYARELSLAQEGGTLKLAMKPVTPEFDLTPAPEIEPLALNPRQSFPRREGALPGELFHVRVEAEGPFTLTLSNDEGEALNVSVSTEQKLVVDRTRAGIRGFNALYDSGLFSVMSAPRDQYGLATLDLYFDRMIAETYLDGGTVVNTSVVFPQEPYKKATLLGQGRLFIGAPRKS